MVVDESVHQVDEGTGLFIERVHDVGIGPG
jgi:hypothetical protein